MPTSATSPTDLRIRRAPAGVRTPEVLELADDFLAVNKPWGWVMHAATPDQHAVELFGWLTTRYAGESLRLVHRLDRETSGVVMVARTPEAAALASGWFRDHAVGKVYLALVHGRAPRKGLIDRPLWDEQRHNLLPARTRYRVECWYRGFTLLSVRPHEGRYHQIRRHLQAIGHPIVGDPRYGPGREVPVPAFPGRMWLHAHRMELPDGRVFSSPLPAELQGQLGALGASERAPEDGSG